MNGYEYVYGSTAQKLQEQKEVNRQRARIKQVRTVRYRKYRFRTLLSLLFCFVMFGIAIARFSILYDVNYRIQDRKRELNTIQAEQSTLHVELNRRFEPSVIYERAVHDLGMVDPQDRNISYYSVKSNDMILSHTTFDPEYPILEIRQGWIHRLLVFFNLRDGRDQP